MTRRQPSDQDSPPLERSPEPGFVPAAAGRGAASLRSGVETPRASNQLGARRTAAASAAQDKASSKPMLRDRLREVLERDRALLDATRSFTHGFTKEESGTRMRLPKAKPRALDPEEIASIDALLNGDFAPTAPVADRSPAAEPYLPAAAAYARSRADEAHVSTLAEAPHTLSSSRRADAEPPPSAAASSSMQPSAAWQAARSWRGARKRRQAAEAAPTAAPEPASESATESASESESESATVSGLAGAQPPPTAETHTHAAVQLPPAVSLFADWIAEELGELPALSPAPIVLTPELAPTLHTATLAPGAPDEGEEARSGTEPIRTRTMARLLAGHGYKARALSIYDELLARRPDDADLRAEADALRRAAK